MRPQENAERASGTKCTWCVYSTDEPSRQVTWGYLCGCNRKLNGHQELNAPSAFIVQTSLVGEYLLVALSFEVESGDAAMLNGVAHLCLVRF